MIHTYYNERDINIEIDIEFNDGCASQLNVYERFKVLQGKMFHPFGCILKPVMERANLDGLSGDVKGYASREVAATNTVIQNTAELYQFCNEKLTVLGSDEHKKMPNCSFFYLPKENIESCQSSFPISGVYRPIPGT